MLILVGMPIAVLSLKEWIGRRMIAVSPEDCWGTDGGSNPGLATEHGMPQLDPAPILGPGGAIARRLPRYESRAEQMAMAIAVAEAIEKGRIT